MITKDLITLQIKSEGVDKVTIDLDKLAKGIKEIELEAKDAKAGIRGLKDENKALKEQNEENVRLIKQFSTELKQLQHQGQGASNRAKQLSQNVQKLNRDIDNNTTQIDKNNASINTLQNASEALIRTMKIEDMTMNQLSKRAEYLRARLGNISKSAEPEKWKKYNDQLVATEKQMKKVAIGGDQVKSRFDSIGNTIKKVMPLMLAYGALRIFQNALSDAKEFIKKSIEVASKAEGVSRAFDKLNDPNLLSILRRETKGLINDLTLMQSTVRAEKFGIPVNDLAKYLKFAQQRAQETGQSVEYLTESIVNGIGRKSKLIIDNLGISAAQLNDEIKKGATFAEAVTKIVDQELAKQGTLSLTSADKATQAAVKWENAQLKVGNSLKWLSDKWNEFSGNIADEIGKVADSTKSGTDKFNDQVNQVAVLETEILGLAKRYDELKNKPKLSADEHRELSQIMNTLSNTIPGIITEFDRYGNILSINTGKVYEYIEAERARLKLVHKDAIESYEKQAENAKKELAIYKERYDWLKKDRDSIIELYGEEYYTNQLKAAEKYIVKYGDILKGAEAQVNYLTGKASEDFVINKIKENEVRAKFNSMTNTQLQSWIKMHENAVEKVDEIQGKFVRKIEGTGIIMNTALGKTKALLDAFSKPQDDSAELSLQKQLELAEQIYRARVGGGYGEGKEEKESKIIARQKKELDTLLQNRENAHKEELRKIKQYAIKNNQTEEQLKAAQLNSDSKYYNDRLTIIESFLKKYNIANEDFLADIETKKVDAKNSQFDLLPQFEANTLSEMERQRDKSIQVIENWFELEKKALAERNLTKTQYDAEYELLELARTETVLAILKKYGIDVEAAEIQNGRIKAEALRKANEEILKQEEKAISDRNALNMNRSERNYDIRSSYGLVSQGENKNREQRALQAELMAEVIDYETYQKALSVLNKKYEEERLRVKEQYGIATWNELREAELRTAEIDYENGLLSTEDYAKAQFMIKMKWAKQYFDYYKDLSSNLVTSLMEAETAKLDAEYDVRIEAAKGNAEETERLEKEKAQKKLDIEKKYADVQFAVKASEIIANTAVAIMTGYAQLGPIAGTVAAVMLGATGAAQLIAANAERQKVKNLTLGGSSDSSAKYERVVTPGKETGGYIDVERAQDGKPFTALYDPEKRGYVDSPTVIVGEGPAGRNREWVAGNALVENPTARPIIDLLDKAQTSGHASTIDMNRLIRARMAGFETGGFIAKPTGIVNTTRQSNAANTGGQDALASVLGEVRTLLAYLSANKIQASVNYQEFKDVESKMTDYENFGNKH